MDQMRGVLRTAVFRLNLLTRDEEKEGVPEENFSLRIITDPDIAAVPFLRLRQDRRIEILSQAEFSSKAEPVALQKVQNALMQKDPVIEQPGPVLRME
jgi:hypothetical protein